MDENLNGESRILNILRVINPSSCVEESIDKRTRKSCGDLADNDRHRFLLEYETRLRGFPISEPKLPGGRPAARLRCVVDKGLNPPGSLNPFEPISKVGKEKTGGFISPVNRISHGKLYFYGD
ncbi:hypothetical protein EG68_05272 [Paragonimus skrjabini miyazakii]|uniref:Uncharacterized protein n=1 Tax=Paragonimus skrjabini miyazakii TaxID=59628 RepID=A0A8S9YVG5_9TREM|nr:hypothetical protein EG68_05272 [Paragonimus skrjabini miyazakii]